MGGGGGLISSRPVGRGGRHLAGTDEKMKKLCEEGRNEIKMKLKNGKREIIAGRNNPSWKKQGENRLTGAHY